MVNIFLSIFIFVYFLPFKTLMSEKQIVTLLQQDDETVLKNVYVNNREAFLLFAQKAGFLKDDCIDAYQDAIVIFREKALQGKIDDLQCSIKTYLFSIGKYILFNKARKSKKTANNFPLEK